MNKKGFTLVELLVTIAILGIITGLSIPLIRNIQQKQQNKKYEIYMNSLISGGKLYIDSYAKDLFGNAKEGCGYITYQDLKDKNLIKDIDIPNVSCDSNYTIVRVNKYEDRYFYRGYLGCGAPKNDNVDVNTYLPEKFEMEKLCKDNPFEITIEADRKEPSAITFQTREIKITASTVGGISKSSLDNPVIQYTFVKKGNEKNYSILNSATWTKANFSNIPKKEIQLNIIASGRSVSITSDDITTPKVSGEYSLIARVDKFLKLDNTPWNKNGTETDKYFDIGTYTFDNSPPTFKAGSKIESSKNGYNHLKPKLKLVIEDNLSAFKDFKYCYSYDGTETNHRTKCPIPKNKNDTAAINKYSKYSDGAVLKEITNKYDGSKHNIYITILDAALNATTQKFGYTVSKEYQLTYNTNGGNGCGSKLTQFENLTWGNLCTPTKTGNTFVEWNTKADGSGTKITSSTKATSNIMAYAKWKISTYKITYNGNGNTGGSTAQTSCNYNVNCTLRANGFTKTGYTFDGWYTAASGGTKYGTTTKITSNKTVYAHWKANNYKITYNGNGNTGGSTAQTNCAYNVNCTLRANGFTKTGYTFDGWYTAASGGTKYGTTTKITSNKTVYAHWKINSYKITYNGNGNTGGSTAQTSCNYKANCTLRANGFSKTGHKFVGWYTAASGGTKYGTTTTLTADKTVYAHWQPYVVNIRYKVNSGETLVNTGKGFSNSGGYIVKGGSNVIQRVEYGKSIGADGLANYSNATNIKITKPHYKGMSGKEWKSGSNTFNQATNYTASELCSTIANGDCTIDLSVNWTPNIVYIQYNTGVSSGAKLMTGTGYNFSIKNNYEIHLDGNRKFHKITYNTKADLWNYNNNKGLYVYKSRNSTVRAVSGAEWHKANGANCKRDTYNQATEYNSETYCDTTNGDCTCTVRVNWR